MAHIFQTFGSLFQPVDVILIIVVVEYLPRQRSAKLVLFLIFLDFQQSIGTLAFR